MIHGQEILRNRQRLGVTLPVDGDEDGTASRHIGAFERRPGLDADAPIYLPLAVASRG